MIDGVHGNTTSLGPRVALDGELVLGTTGLEQRLVGTATTGNDTNHTAGGVLDDLLGTGGELDTGLAVLGVVANDGNVVTGGTAKRTTVTGLLLDVGDNGTLGHGGQGENVADGESGVLTGVDELAGVHALVGDEGLGDHLELVGVAELDLGEGSTTAGIVDDLLDDTTGVTVGLSEVESPELGRGLVQAGVGRCKGKKNSISALHFHQFCVYSHGPSSSALGGSCAISNFVLGWFAVALTENGATALPLVADDTTHGDCLDEDPMLVWKSDKSVVGVVSRTSK